MSERYWYIGWMHTLPTVKGNRLVIYLIVTRKKLRFVQSLPWQTCSWAFFSKGSLSILDFMQVCPCDQRHSNAFHLFICFYSAPQLSIVISPSWNLLSIFRLWLLIALTVSIVTAWLFPMSAYFPFPLFFPFLPHPLPLPALLLAPFFARSLTLVPRSLLRNHTETLATQAILRHIQLTSEWCYVQSRPQEWKTRRPWGRGWIMLCRLLCHDFQQPPYWMSK